MGVLSLLKSRKFWLAVAAIGAACGLMSEGQAEKLVEAIMVIVGVLIVAIGIEDHGTKARP